MTIAKYIVEFLKQYESIAIDTNHIKDGSDIYGLFRSANRTKTERLDDSTVITEFYQFFAKQNAVSEADRQDSDEWLENLTYWLDDYGHNYVYPNIDGNRRIIDIEASGCPTPMVDYDNEILYQISLSITYEREPAEPEED